MIRLLRKPLTVLQPVKVYHNVVITRRDGGLMRINEFHLLYDPTHYALIFPRDEQGWVAPLTSNHPNNICKSKFFFSYIYAIKLIYMILQFDL